MKKKFPLTFDEAFKDIMKYYFEPFATVITDYEIINLPKKVDLVIIEADESITNHVKILKYFKRFNIIEFKSERNRFKLNQDLYKLIIYIAGTLLREKKVKIEQATFTLMTSLKPVKFFKKYNAKEIRQGLYIIENISFLPIYILVIEEMEIGFENELEAIKGFTSLKDREEFIKQFLFKSIKQLNKHKKYFNNIATLYTQELLKIAKKEGINMTIVEKNMKTWAEESGYKEEMINIGIETGIEKGKLEGKEESIKEMVLNAYNYNYSVEEISKITGLSKEKVLLIINNNKIN